jgi:secondary thiamine-phosphate synthase enzyme
VNPLSEVALIDPLEIPQARSRGERGAGVRRAQALTFWTETLRLRTGGAPEFLDVTERVAGIVARSGITEGWVNLFSKHTTAAVVINENEPLLLEDMAAMLGRLSAPDASYGHNDFSIRTVNMHEGECANGHAHCQHLLLATSQTVPIADGHLDLGEWQRIFFLELDRPRDRQLVVQVVGI